MVGRCLRGSYRPCHRSGPVAPHAHAFWAFGFTGPALDSSGLLPLARAVLNNVQLCNQSCGAQKHEELVRSVCVREGSE